MMSTQKTCDKIVFYCNADSRKTYNGKALYNSWPKLPHHDGENAKRWAEGYLSKVPCMVIETPNSFNNAIIYDDVDNRGQSAKVPSAIVYNTEHDCYLKFDFRTDGLIELLINGSVSNGVINSEMAFRYAGSNYFFVRKASDSFKEFAKSVAPKTKIKTTSKVDIGVPFIGAYDNIYVYLGKFKCAEDQDKGTHVPNYTDQMVHVYQQLAYTFYNGRPHRINNTEVFIVNKSKMSSKCEIKSSDKHYADYINAINNDSYIESENITKGSYGVTVDWKHTANFIIDKDNGEVRISSKQVMSCGGRFGRLCF